MNNFNDCSGLRFCRDTLLALIFRKVVLAKMQHVVFFDSLVDEIFNVLKDV